MDTADLITATLKAYFSQPELDKNAEYLKRYLELHQGLQTDSLEPPDQAELAHRLKLSSDTVLAYIQDVLLSNRLSVDKMGSVLHSAYAFYPLFFSLRAEALVNDAKVSYVNTPPLSEAQAIVNQLMSLSNPELSEADFNILFQKTMLNLYSHTFFLSAATDEGKKGFFPLFKMDAQLHRFIHERQEQINNASDLIDLSCALRDEEEVRFYNELEVEFNAQMPAVMEPLSLYTQVKASQFMSILEDKARHYNRVATQLRAQIIHEAIAQFKAESQQAIHRFYETPDSIESNKYDALYQDLHRLDFSVLQRIYDETKLL